MVIDRSKFPPKEWNLGASMWEHEPQAVRELIWTMAAELMELRARVGLNSSNSSKPPSSDPPQVKVHKAPRKPSGRKPGGQPGHPGHCRALVPAERVSKKEEVYPDRCGRCGKALQKKDAEGLEPLRHQVAEIPPIEPEITEYRRHWACCPDCDALTLAELPQGVPQGNFGPMLRALLVALAGRFRLSRREVVVFCEEMLGLEISLGSVDHICQQTGESLEEPVEEVREEVRKAPVVNADETGWREKGVRHWMWVFVATSVVFFQIARRRGSKVVREVLGSAFAGMLVTDRWSAYLILPPWRRQICWAHLKRDFQKFIDRGGSGRAFGEEGLRLIQRLFTLWHAYQEQRIRRKPMRRRMKRIENGVLDLLQNGLAWDDSKVCGFSKKLLELKEALFLFARSPGVEPTNNIAERSLRPLVLWRKGSFGTMSPKGSRFVERMMTVVMSCRLQGRVVLDYLRQVCLAQDLGQRAPSLLPTKSVDPTFASQEGSEKERQRKAG